jgi:hypothetical protein
VFFCLGWLFQILEDSKPCVVVMPSYQIPSTLASSHNVFPPFQQSS